MMEDDRIPVEVDDAIDALNAIRFVFRRDGFVSPKYLREKVDRVKYILTWLEAIMEDEDEDVMAGHWDTTVYLCKKTRR